MKLSEQPQQITDLIERLSRLPGLGRKSATRLTLYFLGREKQEVSDLATALLAIKEEIHFCSLCNNYTEQDPCPLCQDPSRNHRVLCVVESPADLMVIEASGLYRGLYHVLGGVLAPLSGIGPEELKIKELFQRLEQNSDDSKKIDEIVLATGSSAEAEATLSYLVDHLKKYSVKVTRLARGLPVGMDLEYVDSGTLRQALEFRREA